MAITFTSNLDVKNNRITNLGAPTAANDAVTKAYADSIATGITWKNAVRVCADANVDLAAPGAAIDGITLLSGDRVLLIAETDPVDNGIYSFDGTILTRATDADQDAELKSGSAVAVAEGTVHQGQQYVL